MMLMLLFIMQYAKTTHCATIPFNVIVAKDNSGNFTTVSDAVKAAPKNSKTRYMIRIKPGRYKERVEIESDLTYISLIGDDVTTTIITFDRNNDPLYAKENRQFYKDCKIYGTVDFIFGHAKAVFQDCHIYARPETLITVTAQNRASDSEVNGFSFQGCHVEAAPGLTPPQRANLRVFLGRPWDSGLGADTSKRVNWKGYHDVKKWMEADWFTVAKVIDGDSWVPETSVPYRSGLRIVS
ncbi:pectinesterase 2 [Morus notabilis]|uniref:pectinesterase 2 n=1 Tax=Morus notabilis TaxID=981085 RepID=UPI000CED2EB9|nr:pectinesterase 2 [Morus notabilis]